MKRQPSAPPQLPGFTYERYLGGGGFADVFLYEQHRPRRKVAVKVLLDTMLSPAAQASFDSEADLMAQLSSHPSIVTIYEVGRAPDDRPYLVMQFCPRKNLGERYKRDPLSVAEALRTGVEIASAVETAHRAGILHRDIKPHNILVTEYDEPLLTDFGIASTVDDGTDPADGMSIPWSPPESFADPPSATPATDVWALGATVYSLLAGRSPFELPGRPNSSVDLMSRIETARPAPTGRPDVPESLERVLTTAMGKSPDQRYPSALAFARALQVVQAELGFGATPVSVRDDLVEREEPEADDDEQGTRIRRIQSIDPTGPSAAIRASTQSRSPAPAGPGPRTDRSAAAPADEPVDRTVHRGAGQPWAPAPEPPPLEATVHRPLPEAEAAAPEELPEPPRSRARLVLGGVGALAVLGVAAAVVLSGGGDADPQDAPSESVSVPVDSLDEVVPVPSDLSAELVGDQVVFTWSVADPSPGDAYHWRLLSLVGENPVERSTEPTASVPVQPDGQTCIEVYLVRESHQSPVPATGCLE